MVDTILYVCHDFEYFVRFVTSKDEKACIFIRTKCGGYMFVTILSILCVFVSSHDETVCIFIRTKVWWVQYCMFVTILSILCVFVSSKDETVCIFIRTKVWWVQYYVCL